LQLDLSVYQFHSSNTEELLLILNVRGERERLTPWKKYCARVIHVWDNRRGQPHRSAMAGLTLGEVPSGSHYLLRQVSAEYNTTVPTY